MRRSNTTTSHESEGEDKMALPNQFTLPRLDNFDLVSEIATLGFVTGSEAGKNALEILSCSKILYEIYQRVNEDDNKLAALRAQTVLKIADYVKKNPGASNDQLAKQIKKEIEKFAEDAAVIISKK